MSDHYTTVDDGRGSYRDPRLPDVELRWEGETFELWTIAPADRLAGVVDVRGGRGLILAQTFTLFTAEQAPHVDGSTAHLVAQCLYDELAGDKPAWVEHARRFPHEHECDIETTCGACWCCATAATPGCACPECRCGRNGPSTGQVHQSVEQVVLARVRAMSS